MHICYQKKHTNPQFSNTSQIRIFIPLSLNIFCFMSNLQFTLKSGFWISHILPDFFHLGPNKSTIKSTMSWREIDQKEFCKNSKI